MSVQIVLLALGIVVVLAVLGLVFYVVRKSNLTRFRISVTLARWFSVSIEVDSQDKAGELPGNRPEEVS